MPYWRPGALALFAESEAVELDDSVRIRLLKHRFGELDEATHQRLEAATVADLERWTDNVLEARSLEEVSLAIERLNAGIAVSSDTHVPSASMNAEASTESNDQVWIGLSF